MKYLLALFVCYFSPTVLTCGPTVPTSPPRTTTTVPMTTTTTTAAPSACQSCTADQVLFSPSTGAEGSQDAKSRVEPDNAAGCKVLTAICTGPPATFAFMQFNVNQGGPLENMGAGQTVEATLVCKDGDWVYNDERIVTEVNCLSATQPP